MQVIEHAATSFDNLCHDWSLGDLKNLAFCDKGKVIASAAFRHDFKTQPVIEMGEDVEDINIGIDVAVEMIKDKIGYLLQQYNYPVDKIVPVVAKVLKDKIPKLQQDEVGTFTCFEGAETISWCWAVSFGKFITPLRTGLCIGFTAAKTLNINICTNLSISKDYSNTIKE